MLNESVGENIRCLRERKKLTQEDLAGKLGVTRQTVSQWERQKAYPDIEMLKRIAAALDVGLLTVVYGHEEPQPDYGVFPSRVQQILFYAMLALSLVGWFLPWFSYNPGVMGYRYGTGMLVYLALPLAALVQLTRLPLSRRWDALIVLLLLLSPACCLFLLFTWEHMALISSVLFHDISWESIRATTYPGYWLALALSLLPLLFYPLCRRDFSREKKG